MELNRAEFAKALEELGLWTWVRRVGTPQGGSVANPTGFFTWYDDHVAAGLPMYISHNAFEHPPPGKLLNQDKHIFSHAFGDMDTGDGNGLKPLQVWEQVGRLEERLTKYGLDHMWVYSGSDAGFHARVRFKTENQNRAYLSRWEVAFWRGLRHELDLTALNMRVCNPQAMERIPFTRYSHKKDKSLKGEYKLEDNYCVPVPIDLVRKRDLWGIVELSCDPKYFPGTYWSGGNLGRLEDVVREHGFQVWAHEAGFLHPEATAHPVGDAVDLIRALIPWKKCLQTLPFDSCPRHSVRLAFGTEIGALRGTRPLTGQEMYDIVTAVAAAANWTNYNPRITRDQTASLANKVPRYNAWSCPKLKEEGVCIGPSCPLFKHAFPLLWAEYEKTKEQTQT